MQKKTLGILLLLLSMTLFLATQAIHSIIAQKPISYYRTLELQKALQTQMKAAEMGHYQAAAVTIGMPTQQLCVVDLANVDSKHFLCQNERICAAWKKKEANIFLLPEGDLLLIPELLPTNSVECFSLVEGKLFFTIKEKNDKLIIEKI